MIRAIAGTARRRWARATGSKSLHRSSSSKADSQHTTSDTKEEEVDPPHLKRLMYHAKQRGWLELDLMVGNWAETNRRALATNPALMADFEELLAIENPDMYKCVVLSRHYASERARLTPSIAPLTGTSPDK